MQTKLDPHVRPPEITCCGKCKTKHQYNGTDDDWICTCDEDCIVPIINKIGGNCPGWFIDQR